MNSTSIILIVASIVCGICGSLAWRRTSSKHLIASTVFGTFGLLVAAHDALHAHRMEMSFTIAMLIAMLFGGRGLAFLWRSRREPELGTPAMMLTCVAVIAGFGAANAYLNL